MKKITSFIVLQLIIAIHIINVLSAQTRCSLSDSFPIKGTSFRLNTDIDTTGNEYSQTTYFPTITIDFSKSSGLRRTTVISFNIAAVEYSPRGIGDGVTTYLFEGDDGCGGCPRTGQINLTKPSISNLTHQIVGEGSQTFRLHQSRPISYYNEFQFEYGECFKVSSKIRGIS